MRRENLRLNGDSVGKLQAECMFASTCVLELTHFKARWEWHSIVRSVMPACDLSVAVQVEAQAPPLAARCFDLQPPIFGLRDLHYLAIYTTSTQGAIGRVSGQEPVFGTGHSISMRQVTHLESRHCCHPRLVCETMTCCELFSGQVCKGMATSLFSTRSTTRGGWMRRFVTLCRYQQTKCVDGPEGASFAASPRVIPYHFGWMCSLNTPRNWHTSHYVETWWSRRRGADHAQRAKVGSRRHALPHIDLYCARTFGPGQFHLCRMW
mmetsp:Transcript_28029/g.41196  ORF Transcript_28029/g.41196 Transcript_28029/m.41196 type:complete len:265 (-) Transcript_28029:3155-3949(-)